MRILHQTQLTLEDFDDLDLIEELDRRGRGLEVSGTSGTELVEAIYHKRRLGQNFERDLDQLIYIVTGKIV
jgi:hypothetical protein